MISESLQKTVLEHIDKNKEKYVDELRKLAKQPSVSTTGLGIEDCSKMVKELIEKNGFHAELIEFGKGAPVVFGDSRPLEKEKTLLFYSHYDVVPPEPLDQWVCEPFEAKIVGNKIIGRGVSDTKCSIVADIVGASAVKEILGDLPVNVKFVFEGEEEIASQNLAEYLKGKPAAFRADAMLAESSGFERSGKPSISAGVKGSLYVDLSVRTAKTDQHSMWAPIVANAAWRLIWALESIKDEDDRILIEGFNDSIKDPSTDDIGTLKNIRFDEEGYRKAFGIEEYLGGLHGLSLLKALVFNPTATVCGIDSGYKGESVRTVNPRDAKAKVDFRLVPNQNCQGILEKLSDHLRKKGFGDINIKVLRMAEPSRTSLDSRIVKVVSQTAEKLFNAEPTIWPLIFGSQVPTFFFNNLMGIPSTSGPCIGHPESNAHAPNENLLIPNFVNGIKHLASIIMNF
jgi:acetylornithine deacetylase/succinyl-diaminopimelate desuccinylase-like protein